MAGYKANLEAVREYLDRDEEIVASCFGRYSSTTHEAWQTGLLAVTPKRVIFFALTRFGHEHEMEAVDVSRVASVDTAQGLLGPYIDLRTPEAAVMLKWIQAGSPDAFARFVDAVSSGRPPSPSLAPEATQVEAPGRKTASASRHMIGAFTLVLIGVISWWFLSREAPRTAVARPSAPSSASYRPPDPPPYQPPAPTYRPTPPPASQPTALDTASVWRSIRMLLVEGKALPRDNEAACWRQMGRLAQRAESVWAEADMFPMAGVDDVRVRGPGGRRMLESVALQYAAAEARLCVTCSSASLDHCAAAEEYLPRPSGRASQATGRRHTQR